MDASMQSMLSIAVPTLAVLLGILINNSRLADFREDVNRRFDDVNRRFADVNRRFDDVNRRFDDVDKRFDGMATRAELQRVETELQRVEGVLDARILMTHASVTDLAAHIDRRFDDMKQTWRAELHRVEQVIDARLKHFEER